MYFMYCFFKSFVLLFLSLSVFFSVSQLVAAAEAAVARVFLVECINRMTIDSRAKNTKIEQQIQIISSTLNAHP